MPTNEERRDIAAMLREKHHFVDFALDCLLRAGVDDKDHRGRNIIINLLADLIEPEPEKTCRWRHIEGTWYMSECGHRYDRVIPDNYCPNCGAKVVEE